VTPIRYQKRIRLHEARKSMLLSSIDIGEASFRVGYQSHSQFSKDYRQYFGRLPKDDVRAHSRKEYSIEAYTPEIPDPPTRSWRQGRAASFLAD
jgi:AraC-like DNA-binding protein